MLKTLTLALAVLLPATAAQAWEPQKPIEFVVTSGPGGGTDSFARAVQAIIVKHKLVDRPIIVSNKGGGSGAEGFVYGKGAAGDAHKLVFGTNNEYLLPFVANLPYAPEDLTPVAAMAMDEFVLWVNGESPYRSAADLLRKVSETPEWRDYLAKSSQSGRFLTGEEWQAYIRAEQERVRAVYQKQGWLAG